jgi:hypothetical protein
MSDAIRRILPFDPPALPGEVLAHAIAQVPLELDRVVRDRSAGAAGALQLLRKLLQKGGILRQIVEDGDGLAAAPLLFRAQLCDDLPSSGRRRCARQCLVRAALAAAFAVSCRPSAAGTDPAQPVAIMPSAPSTATNGCGSQGIFTIEVSAKSTTTIRATSSARRPRWRSFTMRCAPVTM